MKKYKESHFKYVERLITRGKSPLNVTAATRRMCKKYNMEYNESTSRYLRMVMQNRGITHNTKKIEDTKVFKKAAKKAFNKNKKYFLISWAQNATPVHETLLKNMEAYAKALDADIHIIAGRYKNPTSVFSNLEKNLQHWDRKVLPYLDANRHNIHKYLQVLSDVKIQPTASMPLTGLNGLTSMESCILGHPRLHYKSLPVLENYPHKILATTGAVTIKNYTDSKAGKKGEFHHQLGFIIVELDGENFHLRQVSATENGTFYDLFYRVRNGFVERNEEGVEAIVLGDVHNLSTDPKAMSVSRDMMDTFKPNHTIVHDLFDGSSINPHERLQPFEQLKREEEGLTLKKEISKLLGWVKKYERYNLVIVRSNHDDFFDRFLLEDWRRNTDKVTYLKYANILAKNKAPKGVIPYIIDKRFKGRVIALGINDSYRVMDWELASHGHIGAGGSRGSATQFKNLNTKNITGHTHSPIRIDGHLSVGTLTFLRLGYNEGMNSWMQTNVFIYPNKKAQHINIIEGRYTTLKNISK